MKTKWTDLAMEAGTKEAWKTESLADGIERTVVEIRDGITAAQLGRPQGRYVTLSCPQEMSIDISTRRSLSRALALTISGMMPTHCRTVLVTGLGNRSVTPDALGPRTVERILVTRHMEGCLPENVAQRMTSVCAASPGVLGVTGIETVEVISGMVRHVKPDAVIAVDALAARDSRRICAAIQVADTGITPGSGVGNHQKALTQESLGVPVIAVGVPMVVYASTIARDAVEMLSEADGASDEEEAQLMACVEKVVSGQLGEMIVTPREVDALVERMAGIVAEGINLALHPGLREAEIAQMMAQ